MSFRTRPRGLLGWSGHAPAQSPNPGSRCPLASRIARQLSTDCTADIVPNLILQRDQRRRRYRHRRLCSPDAIDNQSGDIDLSIRIVRIALAVSAEQRRSDARNLEEILNHSRIAQIVQRALGRVQGTRPSSWDPRFPPVPTKTFCTSMGID